MLDTYDDARESRDDAAVRHARRRGAGIDAQTPRGKLGTYRGGAAVRLVTAYPGAAGPASGAGGAPEGFRGLAPSYHDEYTAGRFAATAEPHYGAAYGAGRTAHVPRGYATYRPPYDNPLRFTLFRLGPWHVAVPDTMCDAAARDLLRCLATRGAAACGYVRYSNTLLPRGLPPATVRALGTM